MNIIIYMHIWSIDGQFLENRGRVFTISHGAVVYAVDNEVHAS